MSTTPVMRVKAAASSTLLHAMDAQQCDQCPPQQPSCLIPEFTAECTDECLVLACDDPDHGAQTCLVTDGSTPCDGTCIAAAACNDCTGLDDIVSISLSPNHRPFGLTSLPSSSAAPISIPTSLSQSLMTLHRWSPGRLPFPTCLAIVPETFNPRILPPLSLCRYKLLSPIIPALPLLHPFLHSHPTSIHPLHFQYSLLPSLSAACGQIVILSSTPYPVS